MSETGKTIALIKALAPKLDPEEIKQDVEDWLDDHPEATTTVQDGAITKAKLNASLQGTVDDVDDLKSQISVIDDSVDDIYDLLEPTIESMTGTLITGKFIESNGAITDLESYQLLKVAVVPGKTYWVSAEAYYKKYYFIYHNANDELISGGYASPNAGTTTITDYETTAPDGAAWIYVTAQIVTDIQNVKEITGYKLPRIWTGLKWCAVGDSLTEVNATTTKRYHDYVSQKTGIAVANMGVGGTGYMRGSDTSRAFYQRISNVPLDSDVVTIFGSGNDTNYSAMGFSTFDEALGNVTDTGTSTICGCINTTIDNLYAILPTVQLGIISPTPWQLADPASVANDFTKYANALKTICYNRGIPFLDLYHESNMRPWDADYRELCYSKDGGSGTHPDETGHKIISSHFMDFLNKLISTY